MAKQKRRSPTHVVPRATAQHNATPNRGHHNPRRDRANAVGLNYNSIHTQADRKGITWERAFELMGGVEMELEKTMSWRDAEMARRRRAWRLDMTARESY